MTTITETCQWGCNAVAGITVDMFERTIALCNNWEIRHDIAVAPCDFCGTDTWSTKEYDQYGHSWWLKHQDGSGADHLAIWCKDCGPKHRK